MTMIIDAARKFIKRLARDEQGLTAVEYAVLGGVIVAGITALAGTFEDSLSGAFTALFNSVSS
ncbi:Flp family type IVb pilin [Sphingobium herbicidovorans]|nr:Flp family type IVb pilin [Sphingobium herbicidovorans]